MKISVSNKAPGLTGQYASEELSYFLKKYTNAQIGDFKEADRRFELAIDAMLPEFGYRICGSSQGEVPCVRVWGGSSRSLLCGMYELLEQMGLFFRICGETLVHGFKLDAADSLDKEYRPFCRNRGIRQHINFPMDISSYHLEEAQAYIRQLARMQFNAITFHSYTGQWHGYQTQGKTVMPGNFFYGQRIPVPHYHAIAGRVLNEAAFCIPEVEAILDDGQKRAAFAVNWLNRLMNTAKQAGMRITLSMELPEEQPEIQLQTVRNVLASYPQIDVLEWITPEGGGENRNLTASDANQLALALFGETALKDGELRHLNGEPPVALYGTLHNLKKAVQLYQKRDEIFSGLQEKPIQIGLYVTCRDTLKIVKTVMDRVLPPEVGYTFLPAHGATAVACNVEYMQFQPEDFQKTMLYSWIEFDGNMYLQQNGCPGLEQLTGLTQRIVGTESIHGICLNHWRTAENDIAIAYAAKALRTKISAEEYYGEYAARCGIGYMEGFTKAMKRLGELDVFNRNRLFNIGFCYLGCWLNAPGLGWIRGWKNEDIEQAIQEFAKIQSDLERCLGETTAMSGNRFLRLMKNRMTCSIAHLRAIRTLKEICAFTDDGAPERLTTEQKTLVSQLCDRAMDDCRAYVDLHMEQIWDRGCQGTAVSYYNTIPVYIDHIRQYFVYGEKECQHRPVAFDQPPPPDTAYLNV